MKVILSLIATMAIVTGFKPVQSQQWIWISPQEIAQLPMSGPEWTRIKSDADSLSSIDLDNQDDKNDSRAMAAAMVYQRYKAAGDSATAETYRAKVEREILAGITLDFSRSLAPSRNVLCVVIAGQLIDWSSDTNKTTFRNWVDRVRSVVADDGRSIISTHDDRPNNWGTHAGAARLACAIYLGDKKDILDCVRVFMSYVGQTHVSQHDYDDDLSWQFDEQMPVVINPAGAIKNGLNIDGALPEEQRRCGTFPSGYTCETNYAYEALQGILAQAVMLHRLGAVNVWYWGKSAIGRAYYWLDKVHGQPVNDPTNGSDDLWQTYIVNRVYGSRFFPEISPASHGKAVGWTDWTCQLPSWP